MEKGDASLHDTYALVFLTLGTVSLSIELTRRVPSKFFHSRTEHRMGVPRLAPLLVPIIVT